MSGPRLSPRGQYSRTRGEREALALRWPCPYCGVPPSEPCLTRGGYRVWRLHEARLRLGKHVR